MQPLVTNELFMLRQKPGESLQEFFKRFSQVRSQIAKEPNSAVIHACKQALFKGELNRALNRNLPQTTEELYQIMEEYARGEDGDLIKSPTGA